MPASTLVERDGVRLRPLQSAKEPRRHRLWLWVAVSGVIVAAGAVAAVFGIMNLNAAATLNEETSSIEADL